MLYAVVYLYFLQPELTVHEGDDFAYVCLELQGAVHVEIWVNFTTESHSAIGINYVLHIKDA